jgi:AMP-binding enzyme/Acyltransferase family/Phosphopantetheine attachment site
MPDLRNAAFAHELSRFGGRLAVATPDGTELTYRQLAARVAERAEVLGPTRRLVQVNAVNELDSLITYLAALAGSHPVLLTAAGAADPLLSRYDPDVVNGNGALVERRAGSAHALHPELAVLLSTSGSTGSPKLVRLSAANLTANAAAIAGYLDIRDTDRASAALPMHYCYGLSIINSNLARGAALLLTSDSVLSERFWELLSAYGGTSLHGVPHTFELLDRVGFERMHVSSLRYVTQAGGALAPERVRALARLGNRRGWRFFVMYGQTEATARMAYLPPELAETNPGAVGIPVPGGSFEIAESGELVYRGPNVMLGYASGPADLALGRTVDALHTGDLGRRTETGLYEVIGRTTGFVKLFGQRIDLPHTERILAGQGHVAACTGSDDELIVATESDPDVVRGVVCDRLGLPASHVRVLAVDELPRLGNGKPDYPELTRRAAAVPRPAGRSIRARFAAVLGLREVPGDATFVSLGGDSLSYVQMSTEIERVLGYVPADWPNTPVGALDRLPPRRRGLATVETNIVLRAVAITLIVGTHIGLFHFQGGAHLLLILAGWTFARFCLSHNEPSPAILRSAVRIAVPAMLFLAWRVTVTTDVSVSNVLLIDTFTRDGAPGYWFIEVLVQALLVFAAVLAIPAVRGFERRHGFGFALVCLGIALLLHRAARDTAEFPERAMALHGVLWFFVLGWLAYRADTPARALTVAGLAVAMVAGYFGDTGRELIVLCGLGALLLTPRLRLPRPVVRVVGPIACASLYLYLTHYALLDWTLHRLPAPVIMVVCLGVGVGTWYAVQSLRRRPLLARQWILPGQFASHARPRRRFRRDHVPLARPRRRPAGRNARQRTARPRQMPAPTD